MTEPAKLSKAQRGHDRIWLEPAGAPDRCWCSDNQWGDEGIEYVRADAKDREIAAMHRRLDRRKAVCGVHARRNADLASTISALTSKLEEAEKTLDQVADIAERNYGRQNEKLADIAPIARTTLSSLRSKP